MLGMLRLKLYTKRDTTEAIAMQLLAYADDLMRYPGDIVCHVIAEWPHDPEHHGWPPVGLLIGEIKRIGKDRFLIAKELGI